MLVHSWRWFGLGDRISLEQIVQTGASGIVTALHDVPAGMAWSPGNIRERKKLIMDAGLTWSVVESIPVHEDIKKRSGRYRVVKILIKEDIRRLNEEGDTTGIRKSLEERQGP
jgi:mannonate dehydratase